MFTCVTRFKMELYPWNDSSLSSPPINTYKCLKTNIDMRKMIEETERAVSVLKNQNSFRKEIAVLSRLVYKLNKKFRHDIGFSYLKRTNVALAKYSNFPILNDISTFLDVIVNTLKDYYPTRQMLEFILLRLQTFSKLMCRITACSKKAGYFYLERLRRGDAWWLSFMPYIVLCRIWYLSRHLLKNSCKWYNSLYLHLNGLKVIGVPFVPEGYNFPSNLEEWLDTDSLDDDRLYEDSVNKWSTLDTSSLMETDDVIEICDDLKPPCDIKIPKEFEDIGETISRDEYSGKVAESDKSCETEGKEAKNKRILIETNIQTQNENDKHSIDLVCNIKSFRRFIDAEEKLRENEDEKSLTVHLGFMQWQSLKNVIENLIVKINDKNKRKIQTKIKKIWKEKCDDMK